MMGKEQVKLVAYLRQLTAAHGNFAVVADFQ